MLRLVAGKLLAPARRKLAELTSGGSVSFLAGLAGDNIKSPRLFRAVALVHLLMTAGVVRKERASGSCGGRTSYTCHAETLAQVQETITERTNFSLE